MGWHNVEKLLEQVANHSTLSGKFWTTFFYVLRFLIVMAIAKDVFGDEFGNFKCNTLTPGCPNICFNDFSPISMVRLWSLQLLSVAIPAIIFIVYTAHKLDKITQAKKKKAEVLKKRKEKKEAKRKIIQRQLKEGIITEIPPEYIEKKDEKPAEEKKDDDGKVVVTKPDSEQPSRLLLAYVGQVLIRLTSEIIFMWVQYNTYTYKFWVPEIFKCARYPCKNVVDCFVSRPKEKTIIIWIMFSTGLLMVFLNIIELYHIGAKKIFTAWKNRDYDITKVYKVGSNSQPQFRHNRYNAGYPQAVGIPMITNVPLESEYNSDSA